jgi:CheY-like chemotaxis protein
VAGWRLTHANRSNRSHIMDARQAMNEMGGIAIGVKNFMKAVDNYPMSDQKYLPISIMDQGTGIPGNYISNKEPAPAGIRTPAARQEGGWSILLMDDELFLLELLKEALESMNYRVELSRNGEEAIQKYLTALASGQNFDAVILDLTVHGGMGGKMAIEKLLKINPRVKGIASSGYSEDPIFENPKEYGFCGAIKKPYSIENLCEMLDRVLSE